MTILYGISNCDTIKKAKKWLEANNIDYQFHDYKKQAVKAEFLADMIAKHGLDTVVNKRGTTFRQLPESQKDNLNADNAVALLCENTSMIKRPILSHAGNSWIGFKADEYAAIFNIS
ncbi:ArsC family reductase [Glaciecola sp. SC05]|uniref:ArsC family reductase n=1 Tax=Glaciecola sp. SC05 TaxID=1987355 RepID=UPI003529770F